MVMRGIILIAVLLVLHAQPAASQAQTLSCDGARKDERVCSIIKDFAQGAGPKASPTNPIRAVGVGYVLSPSGAISRRLIALGYSYTSDFHRKIYFPNRLCAIFVKATSPDEPPVIEAAIDSLARGVIPRDNPAYQWASTHEWDSAECSALEKKGDSKLIAPVDENWQVRLGKGAYLFIAQQWNGVEGTLYFRGQPPKTTP
jgi:hypothetical protein